MNAKEHESAALPGAKRCFRQHDAESSDGLVHERRPAGTILGRRDSAVFLYGGWLIIDGSMTIGMLVAFMAYHSRLLSPVQNLMGMTSEPGLRPCVARSHLRADGHERGRR